MIKLRLTVTVEYEANPLYYKTDDPVKMAEIDQLNFRHDPEHLMELIDSENATIIVTPGKRIINKNDDFELPTIDTNRTPFPGGVRRKTK